MLMEERENTHMEELPQIVLKKAKVKLDNKNGSSTSRSMLSTGSSPEKRMIERERARLALIAKRQEREMQQALEYEMKVGGLDSMRPSALLEGLNAPDCCHCERECTENGN